MASPPLPKTKTPHLSTGQTRNHCVAAALETCGMMMMMMMINDHDDADVDDDHDDSCL